MAPLHGSRCSKRRDAVVAEVQDKESELLPLQETVLLSLMPPHGEPQASKSSILLEKSSPEIATGDVALSLQAPSLTASSKAL